MTYIPRGLLCAAVLVLADSPLLAQAEASRTAVGWLPAQPVQGSLVLVMVRPGGGASRDSAGTVTGSLAGQPLHFEPHPAGGVQALGGIPINSRESIPLTLTIRLPTADADHRFVRIPVMRGEFADERLEVNPRFVDPPDSALEVRIAAEREMARAVYRRSHQTPRFWHADFMRPTSGRITSAYGTRRRFNGELRSQHMGVDFDGDLGTPVVAANRGRVALVGDFYYNGRVIYVDHGRGLVTAYLHLSEVSVAVGEMVERGQPVGRIGATGRVTGPHLHWMTKYGPVSVNPLSLLELDLSAFAARPADSR